MAKPLEENQAMYNDNVIFATLGLGRKRKETPVGIIIISNFHNPSYLSSTETIYKYMLNWIFHLALLKQLADLCDLNDASS